MKISELSDLQRQHLAFLLNTKTGYGMSMSRLVALGREGPDEDLEHVFQVAGKSTETARKLASQVENFSPAECTTTALGIAKDLVTVFSGMTAGMTAADVAFTADLCAKTLRVYAKTLTQFSE